MGPLDKLFDVLKGFGRLGATVIIGFGALLITYAVLGSGSSNVALIVGIVGGWFTWSHFQKHSVETQHDDIDEPPIRLYDLSEPEAYETVKEVMLRPNAEKLWIERYANAENGKFMYLMRYEDQMSTAGGSIGQMNSVPLPRQITLNIKLEKVGSGRTSVALKYEVFAQHYRYSCNDIIAQTNSRLDEALSARVKELGIQPS